MTPFWEGQLVRVVSATDPDIHDVTEHIGKTGRVVGILKEAGCGDSYPEDPFFKVRFRTKEELFWKEELEPYYPFRPPVSTPKLHNELAVAKLDLILAWHGYHNRTGPHPANKVLRVELLKKELRRRGG